MKRSIRKRTCNNVAKKGKFDNNFNNSKQNPQPGNSEPNMEVFFVRFPHLSEMIFDELDNQNLSKCREVCKSWKDYLVVQKFLHIRFIKEKLKKFDVPMQPWKEVFEKSNTMTIIRLAMSVDQMPLKTYFTDSKGLHPLHFVAASGNLFLFKEILEKASIKEPRNVKGTKKGMTTLYYAALNGNFEIYRLIMKQVEDKNPKRNDGYTPLHAAAAKGHMKLCEMIMENIDDKSPRSIDGNTPLHLAAQKGHFETCFLLLNKIKDKEPRNGKDLTPLALAAINHHTKVAKLICTFL